MLPSAHLHPLRGLAFALLVALSSAGPAHAAQVAGGAIAGIVCDPGGAPLPGASLLLLASETGLGQLAASNQEGRFLFAALGPGRYDLSITLDGFRQSHHPDLRVVTGQTLALDVALELGPVVEAVVVTAVPSSISGQAGGLGQVVGEQQVQRLPLNGRTFISLAALAPGVALPPGSLLPRINGGRPRTNEYLFDGISVLQPEPGQVAFFPVIDAIQEFAIASNSPPAEFGRFNGGVVNLTTRAGTNVLSGRVFEFLRHDALNARPPFATPDAARTFRRHQFGGVTGGPVVRGRTFFFADYQSQRQTIARTLISTVPTALQRQGIFIEPIGGRVPAIFDPATTAAEDGAARRRPFADGIVQASRIDPVARALLSRYPLPTRDGTANNYARTDDEIVNQDQVGVRFDHRIADRGDRAFVRLSGFRETFLPVASLPDGSGATSGTLGPQHTRASSVASAWQWPVSNTLLSEVRAGDTRRRVSRTAVQLPTGPAADLGLPGLPATSRFPATLPTFQVAGYQSLGSAPNAASEFGTSVTQAVGTLTWLRGQHVVKAGADLRWSRLNVVQPPSPTGSFQFSSLFTDLPGTPGTGHPLASFLLGQVQAFSIDFQQDAIRNRAHVQEYFVQDDWRVSDRITVNAGLRYTLNFPSVEANNQAAVFDLESRHIVFLGRDGRSRSARRLHKLDLGPRLGLSARLTPQSVVRAGYALIRIEQAGITTPFTTPAFPFLQTVSERTLDTLAPAFVLADGPTLAPVGSTPDAGLGQGVFAVNRDLGSGYAQQWHAGWQQELGRHLRLEVSYVGSRIGRVGVPDANLNQLTVEQLSVGPPLLERVPNPFYGRLPATSSLGGPTVTRAQLLKPFPEYTAVSLYRNNIGTTRYHGVEVGLERRFSGGLSLSTSYTRSRLVDDASSVFDASILTGPVANAPVADAFDRSRDRDVSSGDIPHVLVAAAVADLPWGSGRRWRPGGVVGAIAREWAVTGILRVQSGTPVAVTQATNFNAFAGFGVQRPNLVAAPALPSGERSTARWFNTAAFTATPQFVLGTSSRNPVRGPAYRNLDVAIVRTLPLGHGLGLELRVEVFNATNTPALGNPNGVLGSPGFGSITSAGDPRVVQVAARLAF
ncbi:MAG TPA: TonB-dependent receptor [Vicinamibacterales bacterium]|nr:TonB-dependent receptor [Vicinamibacterales bacterium]